MKTILINYPLTVPEKRNKQRARGVKNVARILWSGLPWKTVQAFWDEVERELGVLETEIIVWHSLYAAYQRALEPITQDKNFKVFFADGFQPVWVEQTSIQVPDVESVVNLLWSGLPGNAVDDLYDLVNEQYSDEWGIVLRAADAVCRRYDEQEG